MDNNGSQLSLKSRELSESISSLERTYRLLYYIERIGMLVEREMTDTNLNIMETITKYIDVFSSYEEILVREYRGAQM